MASCLASSKRPGRTGLRAPGPHAPLGCVVTGLVDGTGEAQAALTLARTLRGQGLSVAVMTPAAMVDPLAGSLLPRLAAAGSFRLPESALCPYRLPAAADLATAAVHAGVVVDPEVVIDTQEVLASWVDALVVMGVGGLRARLGPQLPAAQLFARLGLPLVLVRSAGAADAAGAAGEAAGLQGLRVAGWVDADTRAAAAHAPSSGSRFAGAPRLGDLNHMPPLALLQALRSAMAPHGADPF